MKILFLITARAGSKGVPGKNLRRIGGISLIGFKAIAARKSRHCTRLIAGLRRDQFVFYFVHSFHIVCRDAGDVAASCTYGKPFTAAIAHGNVFATQFHPEKSQDSGLQILTNFSSWKP